MGMSVQDIEGKTFAELFPGKRDLFSVYDREVIESKIPRIGLLQPLSDPHGNIIWVQTDIVPLTGEDGEVIGILVVSTDITETERAKGALSLTNHKLNLLSGITRHDIGNELQIIFGYVGLALDMEMDSHLRDYLEKIDDSSKHIGRQIAFTRDYQDIGVHSPVWMDVRSIISQAITPLETVSIQVLLEISGIEMYADPLIGKVFFNLIDNAKRYGETITRIRFYGSETADAYLIICEDDGVGIPDEFKKKIFNREYYKHTGFGLNLSREILDITGISISENGIYGKGARFEIRIPRGGYRKR
jgi:PAS domain S-box-containing protein